MTAKFFVDTNVVLYTIGKDARKAGIARELVGAQPALSTQVVSESISVCLRKLSFTQEKAYAFGRTLMDQTEVLHCIAGCTTLYSEDLQHGQLFDEQLTVVNPFRDT